MKFLKHSDNQHENKSGSEIPSTLMESYVDFEPRKFFLH